MKWFGSKKWLVLFFCIFLVIGQGSLLWAEPEQEEEEELLQPRPNPMDKTGFQFRPNPMEKNTLKDQTGISAKKGQTGISVKSGAPAKWDPFDKNPAMQKNQLVPQAGKSMSIKVQSGVGSGQAAQPGAVMEVGE